MPRDEGQHLPQPLPAPSQSPKSQRRHRETPKLLNPPSIPPGSTHRGRLPTYCSGICHSKVPACSLWSAQCHHRHLVSGSRRCPDYPKSLQQKGASVDICPEPPGPAIQSHVPPPCSACRLCTRLCRKSPSRAETSPTAAHTHSSKDISYPSAQPCPVLLSQAPFGAGRAVPEIQRHKTKTEGPHREHQAKPGFCSSRTSQPR